MSIGWQRLRVPLMERLALLDLAERLGISEEEVLRQIIREAVRRTIAEPPQVQSDPATPEPPATGGEEVRR